MDSGSHTEIREEAENLTQWLDEEPPAGEQTSCLRTGPNAPPEDPGGRDGGGEHDSLLLLDPPVSHGNPGIQIFMQNF